MSATTLLNLESLMRTANGNSGDISVSNVTEIAVDVNCTGKQGTSPTLQIIIYRKDVLGNYFSLYDSGAVSVSGATGGAPVQIARSIGPGCTTTEELGATIRLNWVIGGSSTPGAQFSASIQGK
jgi:hypothetical protein